MPVDGWIDNPNKRLYVWFDAVIGYLSASIEWARRFGETPEDWRKWWCDPSTPGYYFMGKDNITFHSQIWPSEMLGYNGAGSKGGEAGKLGPLNMPEQVVASEFMTMEGRKFSSSRGIVIYVKDILARYPVDAVRYYISVAGPETSDADFTWSEFVRHNNEELAASWGNLVNRVANLMHKNFGEIPALDESKMTDEDRALLEETRAAFATVGGRRPDRTPPPEERADRGDARGRRHQQVHLRHRTMEDQGRPGATGHRAARGRAGRVRREPPAGPVPAAFRAEHSAQKVWEALGGTGVFSPLPRIEEVEDLDKPGFTYPIITGDYKLGETVHPWASEPIVPGTPVAKPAPIFAKIPKEAVEEELARFESELAARREAEAQRLAAEKAKLAAE